MRDFAKRQHVCWYSVVVGARKSYLSHRDRSEEDLGCPLSLMRSLEVPHSQGKHCHRVQSLIERESGDGEEGEEEEGRQEVESCLHQVSLASLK